MDDDRTALVQKNAVVFAKTGRSIYHSHHDIIRFWERAVRRASLPVRLTQGFNPRPRMVFPHALGVGIASRHEEVELEFYARISRDDIASRLAEACAGVVPILAVMSLPPTRKGRRLVESAYVLSGWGGREGARAAAAVDAMRGWKTVAVERKTPDGTKQVDIKPFIKDILCPAGGGSVAAVIFHTEAGSARPDEIARLIGAEAGIDAAGISIVKTGMVVADE